MISPTSIDHFMPTDVRRKPSLTWIG
ncbi:unnamed protein product, partial [Cylindrotheca closterium]